MTPLYILFNKPSSEVNDRQDNRIGKHICQTSKHSNADPKVGTKLATFCREGTKSLCLNKTKQSKTNKIQQNNDASAYMYT